MKYFVLCIINTLLMSTGQIMFKLGSRNSEISSLSGVIKLLFNPIVFAALCLYALTTMLWLYILNKVPISFAYPIQALAFPLVLLFSIAIFKEEVSFIKWIGVMIICFGVYISTKG